MCAASNTLTTQSSTSTTKPIPKWLKMKQQNKSSAGKTAKPTAPKSSVNSAQQKPQVTRDEKHKRWAKKAVPKQRPVAAKRGPVREYISACCSAPAQKPPCGQKVSSIDPETGRPAKKDKSTGLGHFRCSQCKKTCRVKPQAPAPKEAPKVVAVDMSAVELRVVASLSEASVASHQS